MNERWDTGQRLAIGGGAGLVIGSFLPWIKATIPLVGTITRSGMEGGDGLFTLALGAGIVFLAFSKWGDPLWIVGCGVLGLVLTRYEWSVVSDRIATIDSSLASLASVGIGLYVTGLGSILAVFGGEMIRRSRTDEVDHS